MIDRQFGEVQVLPFVVFKLTVELDDKLPGWRCLFSVIICAVCCLRDVFVSVGVIMWYWIILSK
jgi:hypothetical protein